MKCSFRQDVVTVILFVNIRNPSPESTSVKPVTARKTSFVSMPKRFSLVTIDNKFSLFPIVNANFRHLSIYLSLVPQVEECRMKSCSAISGAIWDRMRGARGAPLVSIVLILLMSLTFPAVHGQSSRTSKLSADMDSPTTLNVHVVPHTHDDVGWLKTVEQYYYGENMTIQHACVSDILDSVVSSLVENPSRTFTYVEQKFFSMWWNEQDNAVKETVRFLVANQQLSFVNGGWCMHDEAAAHFIGMIDQTTLGHQFLLKELGVVPKVGWQLDPFGHSASQASLFASKVGFDALYIGRIDHQDLEIRHYTQECEGLWNSSNSLEDTTIFWGLTGSYEGNYNPPRGYCFDIGCDDPLITDYNKTELERSMHIFLERLRIQSDRTKGNHIMITMGSDFQVCN